MKTPRTMTSGMTQVKSAKVEMHSDLDDECDNIQINDEGRRPEPTKPITHFNTTPIKKNLSTMNSRSEKAPSEVNSFDITTFGGQQPDQALVIGDLSQETQD